MATGEVDLATNCPVNLVTKTSAVEIEIPIAKVARLFDFDNFYNNMLWKTLKSTRNIRR